MPHLIWKTHTLDVEHGSLVLSMDDIENLFDSINIAVALSCDGNRRKELNMIRRSKGFNWGAAAISCAYWKGPLLRDVLLAAGVKELNALHDKTRLYVNFEIAEELSEGKYATCIPLAHAMDPSNNEILAYEMNNFRLPLDHRYPLRVIIPGFDGHPGKAPILAHVGRVHIDTTDEFQSVHDDYAQKKLNVENVHFIAGSKAFTGGTHRMRTWNPYRKGQRLRQASSRRGSE